MDCAVVRNSFARESFRDVADEDYIAARCAYRLGLMNHFLWSGLQAIEKYLKAFLLINEVDSRGLSHDIEAAYELAISIRAIGLSLPAPELELLRHINRHGENRYREISSYTKGDELPVFDSLVWNLRRYCKPLRTTLRLRGGTVKDLFQLNLDQINSPDFQEHPYRFKLVGGYLEKVLQAPRTDLRRAHLVWGNRYFGPGKARRTRRSHSVNNYMSRYPEEIDCLRKLVRFPKSRLAEIERMKGRKGRSRDAK